MKIKSLSAVTVLLTVLSLNAAADVGYDAEDDLSGPSGTIISKYLEASVKHSSRPDSAMEVDIEATVPKLNEHGTLRALRKISSVGRITYRVLGFQGDTTVKKEVIARYLQAEQQTQGDATMAIAPANYKFKLKYEMFSASGNHTYIFQLSPRKKRVGLFKGELWLDAKSYLPVLEKGRLVRNPSVFFRKVDFERDFAIENGASVPARMSSTIDTRIIGKVELKINYSKASETGIDDQTADQTESVAANSTVIP